MGIVMKYGVNDTIDKAKDFLLQRQRSDGSWLGELSSSAAATGPTIMALKIVDATEYQKNIQYGADWLISSQHPDGGWGDAVTDPSNINSTSLAVAALYMIRRSEYGGAIKKGLNLLEIWGGPNAICDKNRTTISGVCRSIWCIAGLLKWRQTRPLPLEIMFLPIGLRRKISITLPGYLPLAILRNKKDPPNILRRIPTRFGEFLAIRFLKRIQASNGSYEESPLLVALVVMGLYLSGYQKFVLKKGINYLLDTQKEDGSWAIDRDLEISNTENPILALRELDEDLSASRFQRTLKWLLDRQINHHFEVTGAPSGGFSWAMPGGWPDCDDTSYSIKALRALGESIDSPAVEDAKNFLLRMQNSDGGWGTFVRNVNLPFDHSCPYVTAHAISGLLEAGLTADSKPLKNAVKYLSRVQLPDGSFQSIWFRNYTCGTAFVVEALCEMGISSHQIVKRASTWLMKNQNVDGGWAGIKGQMSTVEETSWALLGLLLIDSDTFNPSIHKGIQWLIEHQNQEGNWNPSVIGLYFSSLWYSDSYYPISFALKALARYRSREEKLNELYYHP